MSTSSNGMLVAPAVGAGMRGIARLLAAGALELRVEDRARLPGRGPAVIAVRHYHHFWDGVVLLAAAGRDVHVVVALDWVRRGAVRVTMEGLTRAARWPVLLRREAFAGGGGRRSGPCAYGAMEQAKYRIRCIRQSVGLFEHGGLLAVFPEGYPAIDPESTVSRDHDSLLPFRPGFARIAAIASGRLERAVPIIPTGLHYEMDGRWRVRLRFGAPVDVDRRSDLCTVVRQVEHEVSRLSRAGEDSTAVRITG